MLRKGPPLPRRLLVFSPSIALLTFAFTVLGAMHLRAQLPRPVPLHKVKGIGLVIRVVPHGPETMVEVDGYRLEVGPQTAIHFSDGLNSTARIVPNTAAVYSGFLRQGKVIARDVNFFPGLTGTKSPAELTREAAQPEQPPAGMRFLDRQGDFAAAPRDAGPGTIAHPCAWHRLSSDTALQQRVRRIGTKLVPAYQKALPPTSRARLHFRFYAINDPDSRTEDVACTPGLVLIPQRDLSRLTTDDQLAAVIADGVARNLQRELSRSHPEHVAKIRKNLIAYGLAGVYGVAWLDAYHDPKLAERQRERMALQLMADQRQTRHRGEVIIQPDSP